MSNGPLAMHYVCTYDEALRLVATSKHFWVCKCGCREGRKTPCQRSRHDVCLMFVEGSASGPGTRAVSAPEAHKILEEARQKDLVFRPFRSDDKTKTDGVCLCCDDCCGYFVDGNEACDKGQFVESTKMDACTQCGACVPVCFFKARSIGPKGNLEVNREACYGCGLCVASCPTECIEMVKR